MMRRDGRTEESIATLIRWAQHDEFWMSNILSMDKLRQKFDQLDLKRQQTPSSAVAVKSTRPQYAGLEHLDHSAGLAKRADGTLTL